MEVCKQTNLNEKYYLEPRSLRAFSTWLIFKIGSQVEYESALKICFCIKLYNAKLSSIPIDKINLYPNLLSISPKYSLERIAKVDSCHKLLFINLFLLKCSRNMCKKFLLSILSCSLDPSGKKVLYIFLMHNLGLEMIAKSNILI